MDKYFAILETANNIIAPGNRCTISKLIEESVQDVLINNYGDGWKNNGERYYSCYELIKKLTVGMFHIFIQCITCL